MKELFYKTRDGATLNALYIEGSVGKSPILFEIHGGGFVSNSPESDLKLCEDLAKVTGYAVASLSYRLAPKHKFPVALNDVEDLVNAILKDESLSIDPTKRHVIGHSAGANLAMGVSLRVGGFSSLVLDYPWLEVSDNRRPYIKGSIPKFYMDYFTRSYVTKKDRDNPEVSPLRHPIEKLKELPRTLIVTCGQDSLRIDGLRLAAKLDEAAVDYDLKEYEGVMHGFVENCGSCRLKKTFYQSQKSVDYHYDCYMKYLVMLSEFYPDVE